MNAKAPIGQFLINGKARLLFYFIFVLTVDTCLVLAMLEEGFGNCRVGGMWSLLDFFCWGRRIWVGWEGGFLVSSVLSHRV